MKNIESRIRAAEVAPVPERLDRSIAHLVRTAEAGRKSRSARWHPLWFAVTGCAVGLLVGIVLGPLIRTKVDHPAARSTTVVVVAPTPRLKRWVTTEANRPHRSFLERSHGEIATVYVAGQPSGRVPSSL